MAAHAVHRLDGNRRNLLWGQRSALGSVFRGPSVRGPYLYPGNHLGLRISSREPYLVGDVHVPVDSGGAAELGSSSSGLDQHLDARGRVLLVVGIMREDLELRSVELLRPMALLAGCLNRAQILDGGFNRSGVLVEHYRIDLIGARQLGANKPGGASSVAVRACDPRVRRILVADFGFIGTWQPPQNITSSVELVTWQLRFCRQAQTAKTSKSLPRRESRAEPKAR